MRSIHKLDRTRQLLKHSLGQFKVGGKFPYPCYRVVFSVCRPPNKDSRKRITVQEQRLDPA
jgi:hypothetical protein